MTNDKYDPKAIETKWQDKWKVDQTYRTIETADKPKYYVLDMFPYPSGEGLHVGHPKGYIATDVISRMKRMQGFNVLHPMGFDAFGLPAEQYAIKMKVNPAVAVEKNIARYKKQLEILGFDYDWSREVNTTDPKYYKWTQWIFLKLLERGLAEERYEPINWCPVDKTGLSNEDIEDGKCERCGAVVEKRLMKQWVLKITEYADRLLADLDAKDPEGKPLLDWPESIKESQRNWIGRSEGAEIDFILKGTEQKITVFTTRADTLFGVTYIVLAPEARIVQELLKKASNKVEVEAYIETSKTKTEIDRTDATKEKTGVALKGILAINPANGEEIPVWVADYVLADYGTGAVMAVPAHDERDFVFAKKYELPIKQVIAWETGMKREKEERRDGGCAVVFDPKTQKYAFGKLGDGIGYDLYGGGVESDEDLQEGIIREVSEESGLHDFKSAEIIDDAFVHYFNHKKNVARVARATCMLVILNSNNTKETKLEAHEDYKLVWAEPEEIISWWREHNSEHNFDHWIIFLEKGISRAVELGFDTTNKKYSGGTKAYLGDGSLINSKEYDGLSVTEARKKIIEMFGRTITKYKLREWVFSRQRYWGEPIPVLHPVDVSGNFDESAKMPISPLSEKDLPLELPAVEHYEPTDNGESPLANISDWVNVEIDGKKYRRETNTMPQWAGSSWYYLRYMDPQNDSKLVDPEREKYWKSVDLYVGGAEHATRHLIYARFWHKFLYDIGVVSTVEPFTKLQSVGLIMASDGRKMSKRWGNVINPDEMVDTFGADSMRLYEMFMGPFDQAIAWNTNGVVGTRRFIEKVWRLSKKIHEHSRRTAYETIVHKTIKKVSEDIESLKFNTAVSTLMILVNDLEKEEEVVREDFEILLKLLAPFAPHVTEELWEVIGHDTSIHLEPWPVHDSSKVIDDVVNIAVQVNGKTREVLTTVKDLTDDAVVKVALELPGVQKWVQEKPIKRVIWVKNRILNLIIDL